MSMESGIGRMEAAAAMELDARARENAIESRITGGDVQALNDTAQLDIYGSGDRTFVDPTTGEVIASPDSPRLGLIEEMRENRRFGTTEAERNAAADKYASDIEYLVNDGYELCQARMIMDMRINDVEHASSRLADLVSSGVDLSEAADQVEAIYAKKDARRLELIKEGGAFTPDEYEAVRNGEDLYDEDHASEREKKDEPKPEVEVVRTPELDAAEAELKDARTHLATLRARRESSTFTRKKNTEKQIDEALEAYERAKQKAGMEAMKVIWKAGAEGLEISGEDLTALVNMSSAEESEKLTIEQFQIEMKTAEGRKFKRFYDFWARNSRDALIDVQAVKDLRLSDITSWSGIKSALKKGGATMPVMMAVGTAAGVVAAPVMATGGAVAVTAGLGIGLATKIGRGIVTARVGDKSRSVPVAAEKARGRLETVRGMIEDANSRGEVFDASTLSEQVYKPDTEEVIGQNRKRVIKIAGASALVGGLAAVGTEFITGDLPGGHDKNTGGDMPKPPAEESPEVTLGPRMTRDDLDRFRTMNENPEAFARYDARVEELTNQLSALYPKLGPEEIAKMAGEMAEDELEAASS